MKGKIVIPRKTLNTKDARYRRHEQLINATLHGMLTKRCRNIRPAEVCRQAKVSRTTFYTHYDNVNFVEQYELKLKQDFCAKLPKDCPRKETLFTILLSFVRKERGYFEATMPNANFWLLQKIFVELHPVLKAKDCSSRSYEIYAMQQIALISCWVQHDKCAMEKMRVYMQKMATTPMMRADF